MNKTLLFNKHWCALIGFVLLFSTQNFSQTTLFSEDFESCTENYIRSSSLLCGWVEYVASTSDNSWAISNNNPISGSYSLTIGDFWSGSYYDYYTGDNCNKVAYHNTLISSIGYTSLLLDFNWRCYGESTYDYGKLVYSFDGTTWIDVNATRYELQSGTQSVVALALPAALDNTNFYLGFKWINDGSVGTDPPFTVDDIQVYVACSTTGGIASASTTSICNSGTTILSLAGETASSTYQWQSSPDGST